VYCVFVSYHNEDGCWRDFDVLKVLLRVILDPTIRFGRRKNVR
jgi:hypothetical protein